MDDRLYPEVTIGVLRIFQRQGQTPLVVLNISANGFTKRIGIAWGTQYDLNNAPEIDNEAWDRLIWDESHFHL